MAAKNTADGDTIIIKKYANRRLYNTQSSSYITLEDLARMVRTGVDFQVLDAKTGSDITHTILTQIIMEEEANGEGQQEMQRWKHPARRSRGWQPFSGNGT